jgi:hypothetical protein
VVAKVLLHIDFTALETSDPSTKDGTAASFYFLRLRRALPDNFEERRGGARGAALPALVYVSPKCPLLPAFWLKVSGAGFGSVERVSAL